MNATPPELHESFLPTPRAEEPSRFPSRPRVTRRSTRGPLSAPTRHSSAASPRQRAASPGVRQRAPRVPTERGREEPPARLGRGRREGEEEGAATSSAASGAQPQPGTTCGGAGKLPAVCSPCAALNQPNATPVSCATNHWKETEFLSPLFQATSACSLQLSSLCSPTLVNKRP
ncbi:single-pass membrane and coiled-coil domain-containing protein 4 isoform X1 [Coturnix japonica]|uniref:single-pass membrane and coiled-coil domain-containing protein 4 isoform X1 n=1 Tax=Coturnix japonica TaxID=93934 RepID=UPI000777C668|nr:single-pass membrane and coiled-coil domain-containing protein 4 isoform X1 [Coturnix japonica]